MATISPVRTSATMPAAALALNFSAAAMSSSRSACWTRRSSRQDDRRLLSIDGEAGAMQVRQAAPVEPFLDAGDALVVDVDVADQMRDLGRVRIDPLVLGQETDTGNAEPMNFDLLLGRDFATKPDEPALRGEPLAQLGCVLIGQHRGQQFDRFVDVDDPMRLAEQRGRSHVGRQHLTVAVDDVGTGRADGILARRCGARCGLRRSPRT